MNTKKKPSVEMVGRVVSIGLIPGMEKAKKPSVAIEFSANLSEGRATTPRPLPEGFDIWTSSEEQVSDWIMNGVLPMAHPGLAQWAAAMLITANREKIETDGVALLAGISAIARQGLVMPPWMANSYVERFLKVERLEVGSLDEAFGPLPFKKGKQLAALRQRRHLIPKISRLLLDAMNADPNRPIDKSLFEEVGKQLGKSATFTEEAYREGVRDHGMQDIKRLKDFKLFPYRKPPA
jgi:hypothetical protein